MAEKPKLADGDFYPPRRKRTMTEKDDPPPEPEVIVTTNGTNPTPIPLLQPPTSPQAILNNLICREIIDPSGPLEPLSPTVVTLQEMVNALAKGTNIAPYKEHIQQVATNQPEKGDVIRAYINQVNHELIADLTVIRANAMRVIKRATSRNDMSVSEALVVWRMCNEQLPELQRGLSQDKPVDSVTVVEKIDYARQQAERVTRHEWEGTSPQGRELIRKKLWEVKREMELQKAAQKMAAEESAKKPS